MFTLRHVWLGSLGMRRFADMSHHLNSHGIQMPQFDTQLDTTIVNYSTKWHQLSPFWQKCSEYWPRIVSYLFNSFRIFSNWIFTRSSGSVMPSNLLCHHQALLQSCYSGNPSASAVAEWYGQNMANIWQDNEWSGKMSRVASFFLLPGFSIGKTCSCFCRTKMRHWAGPSFNLQARARRPAKAGERWMLGRPQTG